MDQPVRFIDSGSIEVMPKADNERRALEARNAELKWMTRARTNSVLFTLLWTSAPILVSLVSFSTFIISGHKLDVATAFTALALFSMVRQPLNVIPTWVVQILQTKVALDRIAGFLGEEEVDGQVSALKVDSGLEERRTHGLGMGFVGGASFGWNEVKESEKKEDKKGKKKDKKKRGSSSTSSNASEAGTAVDGESQLGETEQEQKFELRDLNVLFPEGRLTLITGPTASGKTALLVSSASTVLSKMIR
jgi:ABC-type multidrug transport system fused ATPase/permease subunit